MKLHIEWMKESDPWERSHLTRKTHSQSPVIHASSSVCNNGIGLSAQTEAPVKVLNTTASLTSISHTA